MKHPPDRREDSSLDTLRSRKVFLLQEVVQAIGRSIQTARRRLKEWKVVRSYNNNGRYYALRETARFDAHSLWQYRGISFSRYGNLTETVVESICRSEVGVSAQELGERLRLNPRSFLSAFAKHPRLRREKHLGRFVYYAADPAIYSRQHHGRISLPVGLPDLSESDIVAVLVEQIKHPQTDPDALSRRLRRKHLRIQPESIRRLFAHHGLEVKKTPRSV